MGAQIGVRSLAVRPGPHPTASIEATETTLSPVMMIHHRRWVL